MGRILKTVPFFSDELTLFPNTAHRAEYLNRPVSIREFAGGLRVRLQQDENTGEYVVQAAGGALFMEGPAV